MISKRVDEVIERRQALLTKIELQRQQVSRFGQKCIPAAKVIDTGIAATDYIKQYPWVFGGFATLMVFRRRGTIGALKFGWRIWKSVRTLQGLSKQPVFHFATQQLKQYFQKNH